MRALIVRRAGEFEKTTFDLSIIVGILGVFPGSDISAAIVLAWPSFSFVFFGIITLAGIGGRISTWKADRDRTVTDIRHECQAEAIVLGILALCWTLYASSNFVLLLEGRSATIPMLMGLAILVASLRRGRRIWRDLRKLNRALVNPQSATPAPLADPDDKIGGPGGD
ncbi:hypothetical protein CH302_19350 [Rhodococcus sp. 15-2388-1-1a]|uniref:hypothetical protein n=1 Tax=Nocardiaceae TaxID=85025 RepID=UPI00055E5170|nr:MULTISPECIES: hypothetical protein [Rhodococcus]OZE95098.1 hypothetical protein CH302_19350 [Rhodococcus sp. 15-2388-1-1a]